MKRKQFGVIGLGRFGSAMAMTLTELGHDVIGVDGDESRVQQLADVITHALQIDATDEKALRAAGIQDVDVAVVSIGENIESSLLVVMQLRELGIETIVAKAVTPLHGRILEKLGVSRVIFPGTGNGDPDCTQPGDAERNRLHRALSRLQHRRGARAGQRSSGARLSNWNFGRGSA